MTAEAAAARQEAWTIERSRILVEREEVDRECRLNGRDRLAWEQLPTTPPNWFQIQTGIPTTTEARLEYGRDGTRIVPVDAADAPEPNTIRPPEGTDFLGRRVRPETLKTPEEIFSEHSKPTLAAKVRKAVAR